MRRIALSPIAGAMCVTLAACSHEPSAAPAAAPPPAPVQVDVAAPAAQATAAPQPTSAPPDDAAPDKKMDGAAGGAAHGGRVRAPVLRQGATTVTGKMAPEVIQRIIRQNFGRFRLCYENGLRNNASLTGRVAAKFTIDAKGAVTHPTDGGSDLPDKDVIACVLGSLGNLAFPQPEGGGTVDVVYPIIMTPGIQ